MSTTALTDLCEKQRKVIDVLQDAVIRDVDNDVDRRELRETGATLTNAIDKLATLNAIEG
jgi:hypothetical protein